MPFFNKHRCRISTALATLAMVALFSGISPAEDNLNTTAEKPGAATAVAQPQPDKISAEYIKGCFTDSGKILTSPVNWDGSDWLTAGLVAGATTGVYFLDGDIKKLAQRNQSSTGHDIASTGNILGNPFYVLPSLGLFYLYGNIYDDSKARRTSLLAVESVAISGVFTMAIKFATQRPRPFSGADATTWDGPGLKNHDPSFPSAHTQTAFSLAAVVAEEYGDNATVPPIVYGLASFVALSRMYDNKHWASDVFAGGAIGYLIGKTVVRYHNTVSNSAVKILPTVGKQGFGLMAEYRF